MSESTESPPPKRLKLETEVGPGQSEPGKSDPDKPEPGPSGQSDPGPSGSGIADSKYGNYVTPEELQKLREFKVLDEVKSNDEDSNDEDSDISDGKSEGLPDEEIEKMLEEDLPEGFKGAPKPKEKPYVIREKIVLEEKGVNQFEVLPLDWLMVRHVSGIPLYVHRTTRVATLAKPYFLGKGNTRRHEIPISAIPCLAYRRALEEEEKQKEIDRKIAEQIANGTWAGNTENGTSQNKSQDFSQDIDVEFSHNSQQNIEKNYQNQNSTSSKENDLSKEAQNQTESSQNSTENSSKISKCPFSHKENKREELNGENCTSKSSDIENLDQNKHDFQSESENQAKNKNESEMNNENESEINNTNESEIKSKNENEITNKNENEIHNKNESLNESTTQSEEIPLNRRPVVLPGGIVMPPPRVETVNTSWKTQHLTAEQINDYCKKLFKFKTINIMHFKRWADRRKYTKARKTLQYPTLPEGTKLITIPAQNTPENGGKAKRDWVMNMNGSSYLSVFHEYVWRALHKQPVYEFKQLENASCPYQATVFIGGMRYGVGRGSSKRQAKSAAARASIHVLIPEMKDHLDQTTEGNAEPDFSFFDYVGIEDPRIQEFCSATSEPSPHAILRTCLLRNFGAQDRHIHTEMKKLEYQKIELTMKVGKHSATVVCKNKKQAKQRASQAILQQLHPHIRSWGSLLRLYGSRSVKSCKEKKLEEQQITLLQDKARHNEPNYAVLEKLRNEMRKLRERDEAVVPIGTLLVADDLPTHSGSNLNNVDL